MRPGPCDLGHASASPPNATMRFRQRSFRRPSGRAAAVVLAAFAVLATFACSLDTLVSTQASTPLVLSVAGDTTVGMGAIAPMSIATPTGVLDLTKVTTVWSSDKPTVATVDATTGVVTGVALGDVNISAKVVAPEL